MVRQLKCIPNWETVYQEALEIELGIRKIPFSSQQQVKLFYKGIQLKKEYIPDLMCYEKIVVEIKALDKLTGKEEAQIINALKTADMTVGLLINFGSVKKLEWKRFVYDTAKYISLTGKNISDFSRS